MPHQCVHCGKLYPDAAPELLAGCSCGSRFFFYIKKELAEKIKKKQEEPVELKGLDKKEVEKEVREMIGVVEDDVPVILSLESIKVIKPGKFEIDIVNLFDKNRPLIYKLEEGKYIIDLASTMNADLDEINKKIKKPERKKKK